METSKDKPTHMIVVRRECGCIGMFFVDNPFGWYCGEAERKVNLRHGGTSERVEIDYTKPENERFPKVVNDCEHGMNDGLRSDFEKMLTLGSRRDPEQYITAND